MCKDVKLYSLWGYIQKPLFNGTLFFATLVFVAEGQTLKILTALNLYEHHILKHFDITFWEPLLRLF